MEYAIEPVEICLHKSCYITPFLRFKEDVRITCYMFSVCNIYVHKMLNSFYTVCIWKLLKN